MILQTVPLSFSRGRLTKHFPYKRQRNTQNCTKFAPPFKATTTVNKPKTVKIKSDFETKKVKRKDKLNFQNIEEFIKEEIIQNQKTPKSLIKHTHFGT